MKGTPNPETRQIRNEIFLSIQTSRPGMIPDQKLETSIIPVLWG